MLKITTRSLLIEQGDRLILIDCGHGEKQNDKYYKYKYLDHTRNLKDSLGEIGKSFEDITDVVFTHLHDDHCGGAVIRNEKGEFDFRFPNAMHYVSKAQFNWALKPNKRESAAFYPENIDFLAREGKLMQVDRVHDLCQGVRLHSFNGHTMGQLIPFVEYMEKTVVAVSDLIPSAAHIPLSWLASVDISPLIALQEKEHFLYEAAKEEYILFMGHDYYTECCTVKQTEKGVQLDKSFTLEEALK